MKRLISLVFLCVVLNFSCTSAQKFQKELEQSRPPSARQELPSATVASLLDAQKRAALPGLESEDPLLREGFRLRAAAVLKKKFTGKTEEERRVACIKEDLEPFCGLFSKGDKHSKNRRSRPSHREVQAAWTAVRAGKLTGFERASPEVLRAALQRARKFNELSKASNAVLAANGCEASTSAGVFATKIEEFFPDRGVRTIAQQLYTRNFSCQDDEQGLRSGFRGALLHIWDDRCDLAFPMLEKVAKTASDIVRNSAWELRSRALFWMSECARQGVHAELGEVAKGELIAAHPFTLHALLTQTRFSNRIQELLDRPDTELQLRSLAAPELNARVLAVEILLSMDEDRYAAKMLREVLTAAPEAEPRFRLYLAYLQAQAGDYLEKFKTLSPLLRDNPELVSHASLQLFYPKSDPKLQRPPQNVEFDEYLILSLVRQESAFDKRARSGAGAMGLMQLMPSTARRIERVRTKDLYEPAVNVRIGSKFFNTLLRRFEGDTELALAAYNAGPLRVDDWTKRYPIQNRLLFLDLIPFRETREYVSSIARNYFWYRAIYPEPQISPLPAGSSPLFRVFQFWDAQPVASGVNNS